MPPKKEAKNASSDAPRQLDKLKRAEGEVIALQRQLQMLTIEHKEARALEQSWRRKVGHYEAVLAKKDQDMDDITKSMARKSTAIQDQKQALIEDLEQRVQLLTSEKEALEAATDQARKAAEDAAHAHKTEVESLQRRLQGMHLEYSQMLQQTLTKLHDEVLSPYVNEAARNIGGAIQHKLEKSMIQQVDELSRHVNDTVHGWEHH